METISISHGDYEPLKRTTGFDLDFQDDKALFIAVNEELGIKASSESIAELKEKIISILDFMVDYYIIQGQGNPSAELKKSIDTLKTIVDVSKRASTVSWKMEK